MKALFERFEIHLTKKQALTASHPGPCDQDVRDLLQDKGIIRQLAQIPAEAIRAELQECGAWDEEELKDDHANQERILWIAAGNIREGV